MNKQTKIHLKSELKCPKYGQMVIKNRKKSEWRFLFINCSSLFKNFFGSIQAFLMRVLIDGLDDNVGKLKTDTSHSSDRICYSDSFFRWKNDLFLDFEVR